MGGGGWGGRRGAGGEQAAQQQKEPNLTRLFETSLSVHHFTIKRVPVAMKGAKHREEGRCPEEPQADPSTPDMLACKRTIKKQ